MEGGIEELIQIRDIILLLLPVSEQALSKSEIFKFSPEITHQE